MPTLESSLVILDRASAPVRGIRREVRGLQNDAEKAGKALDDMAGPKAARDLQKLADDTRVVRGALRGVREELAPLSRGLDTYSRRLATTRRETDKFATSTDRLVASLKTLGGQHARPRVEIAGIVEARVELAALRAELRAFGASRATATAGVADSVTGGVGGAGRGAGRTGAYIGTGGFGIVTSRTRALAGAAVVALPVVQALGGATAALAGSLSGAGVGAGAVGIAGGGVLAAGLGAVVPVAKAANTAMEEATKAREKYNEAVRESGKWSKEAAHAERDLALILRDQPGLRRATREVRALNREWKDLTAPGRQQWFGLRGDVAQVTRRVAPRLAANSNLATGAVRRAAVSQARLFAGDEAQDTLAILTREFARDLPVAERALQDVELVLLRIARASRPFFREGIEWIEETTSGWERSTRDVGKLRREIGGYVEDLRDWGDLTGSAFELVKDVLMGGRPAGGSAVEDLTKTLDRWDRWVERNPEKMDRFFRNAVSDTEAIAGSVVDIVHGLNDMAAALRPLLGPLTTAASAFGGLAGSLSPGAAATAFLALRAGRNQIAGRRGRGGGGGGGGAAPAGGSGAAVLPFAVGAGAAGAGAARRAGVSGLTLAERGQRFVWARQLAAQQALYGGAGMSGTIAGARAATAGLAPVAGATAARGARTAGRFALPAVAIGGLSGAFGQEGANQGDGPFSTTLWGLNNALQGAGAIFGIANPVLGTDERVNRGLSRASQVVSGLPGSDAPTAAEARRAARGLAPELARAEQAAADAAGNRNDFAEAMAYLKALRGQAQAYRDIAKEAKHAATVERNERSREHAGELTTSFGEAFDVLSPKVGIEAAMDKTVRGVYTKMRGMNRTGAKILGENVMGWAREQARANPELLDEVEWLNRRIRNSFSKTGERVQIVNGRILTGSKREWSAIADAMIDPAERARQEVSRAFTAIQQQAVGSLRAMGFSPGQARSLVRGLEKGGAAGAVARSDAKAGPSPTQLAATDRNTGDGIGDGPGGDRHAGVTALAAGSPGLMGAKPGLAGYASAAAEMGLRVSSGLRGGAITSSGNRSYHASGDALDLAGSPAAMMRFAQYAADKWGSHLEELIYTPFGRGQIKNGRPYVYSGQVAADHHDHVHIADTAPTGGGGPVGRAGAGGGAGGSLNLRAPKSGLLGVPGAMSTAASSAFAKGLSEKLNEKLGSIGNDGATLPGIPGMGNVSAGAGLAQQLRAQFGLPAIFDAIRAAESGNNPNARNPSGASGWYQIMMPLHAALVARVAGQLGEPNDVFDPEVNTGVAKALYDESGLSPWTASRGVWGRSGDGHGWDRPSAGLGGGPARISVQGGSGGNVTISAPVSVQGGGASERRMRAIVDAAMSQLAGQIMLELDTAESVL